MKKNIVRLLMPIVLSTIGFQAFAGNSGGGGDLKPGNPVSTETVKDYLQKIQIPVELSFKYLSVARYNDQGYFGTQGTPGAIEIGKLIYLSNPDIFSKIRNVKPSIVTDGSCKINGVSKDGAAYSNPDRICLDAARIASNPKIGDQNMGVVTVALAAHEYSHLVGTSEDQAVFVQDLVKEYTSEKLAEKFSTFLYSVNRGLDEGAKALQVARTDIQNKAGWAQVCMDVTSATDMIAQATFGAHDNNNGIGFFSRRQYNQAMPYFRAASTFEFACKNDSATNSLRDFVWGSSKAINEANYMQRRYPHGSGNILTGGLVRRMDYGDASALEAGIEGLLTAVQLLKSDLPAVK